ncbi:hypothetical protein CYMTET_11527 [Cymbomonas tetramitiformis]|uniref:Uncharacterized protein n=1 Tax=Cymbomonas tetramitiformis TaxID=36881 RepID=A0AAE0LDD8_9CHLO|nr:hypothetical protein CYMTET_11527 [Cymbomonas tetramitiformis]
MVGVRQERQDGQRPRDLGSGAFYSNTIHRDHYVHPNKIVAVKLDPEDEGGKRLYTKPAPNLPPQRLYQTSTGSTHNATLDWYSEAPPRFRPHKIPFTGTTIGEQTTGRSDFAHKSMPPSFVTYKRGEVNEFNHPPRMSRSPTRNHGASTSQAFHDSKPRGEYYRHKTDIVHKSRPALHDPRPYNLTTTQRFYHDDKPAKPYQQLSRFPGITRQSIPMGIGGHSGATEYGGSFVKQDHQLMEFHSSFGPDLD